jgi:hypothetical protein
MSDSQREVKKPVKIIKVHKHWIINKLINCFNDIYIFPFN